MAARRSSRLKAKDATSPAPAAEVCEPSTPASDTGHCWSPDLEDDAEVRPPRKRQKKTAVKVKKTGARLKMLAEMPVDVLLEIFSHLRPVDVLHLAWTSRELRQVLMRRSAISVWRGAFDSMPNVPECPADQTLPQWARLLFVPHCHLCLAPSVTTILFPLRMRACQTCLSNDDIFGTCTREGLNTSEQLCLEQAGVYVCHFPYAWSRVKMRIGRNTQRRPVYLLTQTRDMRAACLDVLKRGEDALKAFLSEKWTMIEQINQHARLCDQWYEEQREGRAGELSSIRSERRARIIEKLKELGYEADISYVVSDAVHNDCFQRHALVRKSQKLTPKIWSNIQQTLVDYILTFRPQRLAAERVAEMTARGKLLKVILAKHRASLPSGTHIPPDGDIGNAAPFCAVWDVDPHAQICEGDFDEALTTIPDLFEPWSQAVDNTLLKVLDVSDRAILQLATSMFQCEQCPGTLLTRDVPGHACFVRPTCTSHADEERERLLYRFYYALDSAPWNERGLLRAHSSKTMRLCVEQLARACGLDPMTATPADMDAADATFTCVWCAREDVGYYAKEGQTPMRWFAAVRHHFYHPWGDTAMHFVRAT